MYPDSQQLFVGNLPHNCTESDLESLFSQFGKVIIIHIILNEILCLEGGFIFDSILMYALFSRWQKYASTAKEWHSLRSCHLVNAFQTLVS